MKINEIIIKCGLHFRKTPVFEFIWLQFHNCDVCGYVSIGLLGVGVYVKITK